MADGRWQMANPQSTTPALASERPASREPERPPESRDSAGASVRNTQSCDELIRTVNLTKVYGSGENAVRALDGVNLTVQRGELMAVMGPSGCGKSTLLNLLGALDQPTAGEVWVAGENLARLRDVDAFRARTVGFVFQ